MMVGEIFPETLKTFVTLNSQGTEHGFEMAHLKLKEAFQKYTDLYMPVTVEVGNITGPCQGILSYGSVAANDEQFRIK